jgi:GAF domain-containing protein
VRIARSRWAVEEFLNTLRPLADTSEIKAAAARILGEQLCVNRVFYAEVDGGDWLVAEAYEQGVERRAEGRHEIAGFGQWIVDMFRAGQVLVIRDLDADRRFEPSQRAAHAAYHIFGAVAVPLVKDGTLVAIPVVHSATPGGDCSPRGARGPRLG